MITETFKKLFADKKVNEELRTAYQAVYKTPEGEKVLKDLLEKSGVTNQSYIVNDTHTTAFNEGKRRLGLRILSFLEAKRPETINKGKK